MQRRGKRRQIGERLSGRQRPAAQPQDVLQSLPRDEIGEDEHLPVALDDVVVAHDMRVLESFQNARLAPESFQERRLLGNVAAQHLGRQMHAAIDVIHAKHARKRPLAEQFLETVPSPKGPANQVPRCHRLEARLARGLVGRGLALATLILRQMIGLGLLPGFVSHTCLPERRMSLRVLSLWSEKPCTDKRPTRRGSPARIIPEKKSAPRQVERARSCDCKTITGKVPSRARTQSRGRCRPAPFQGSGPVDRS